MSSAVSNCTHTLHHAVSSAAAGAAYSHSGEHYLSYADGDPERLFSFDSHFAYADAKLWAAMSFRLRLLRADGKDQVSILDAGCGPGTWLRRIVTEAHRLGFKRVDARGFDLSEVQIAKARELTKGLAALPGVELSFEVGDITAPMMEADRSVDLTLCLYCVLNHLPVRRLPEVMRELARVTRGDFITTVRAIGSIPTAFVDSLDHARAFLQDNRSDRFTVELVDGQTFCFPTHLFAAEELRSLIGPEFAIDDLRGLDLFHSRFSPDPRWNPDTLPQPDSLKGELADLENRFATHPDFIDRGDTPALHCPSAATRACGSSP